MIELNNIEDFDKILENSKSTTILIFKHSTRCPTSAHAKAELEKFLNEHPQHSQNTYLVKVIESRQLSNHISETTGIEHHSPQLLVLKNGKVEHHISHFKITTKNLEELLSE